MTIKMGGWIPNRSFSSSAKCVKYDSKEPLTMRVVGIGLITSPDIPRMLGPLCNFDVNGPAS
jgi:hypothetical protein